MSVVFPWRNIDDQHKRLIKRLLGTPEHLADHNCRPPDLLIAPYDVPYLYRWHVLRDEAASVYIHVQVDSDAGRDLHDHPWDNQSVILAGGYDETYTGFPTNERSIRVRELRKGDCVSRKAKTAHRLDLPKGCRYSISLFTTGPRMNEWGFWTPRGWVSHKAVTKTANGISTHIGEKV